VLLRAEQAVARDAAAVPQQEAEAEVRAEAVVPRPEAAAQAGVAEVARQPEARDAAVLRRAAGELRQAARGARAALLPSAAAAFHPFHPCRLRVLPAP